MKRGLQTAAPAAEQSDRNGDGAELLSQVDVCRRLGICDETWMRWRRARRTPDPVILPSGRLKWRVEDIDQIARAPRTAQRRHYFQSAVRYARKVAAFPDRCQSTSCESTAQERTEGVR